MLDQTNGAGWFDGDDAVVLTKGPADEVIDVIGQVGLDPGAEWGTNLAPAARDRQSRPGHRDCQRVPPGR